MTTITIDRATVEQALECLKGVARGKYDGNAAGVCAALEAALAQQAEPDHETRAELAEQQVVQLAEERDHYRNLWQKAQQAEPDAYGYASRLAVAIWEKHYKDTAPHWRPLDDLMGVLTQIDNMTSGLTPLAQQAEPVEPVAWIYQNMYTEQEYLVWKKGTGGRNWRPLYTAPPQRKPLTEEEIERIWRDGGWAGRPSIGLIRAVERAHGITDPQVADRLARHGIPMPEGDPK